MAGRTSYVGSATIAADPYAPALVLVTHHVEEIPPGFTHVLLLRAGKVVAAGPIDTTLTSAALGATFGLPLALERVGDRWAAARRPEAPARTPRTRRGTLVVQRGEHVMLPRMSRWTRWGTMTGWPG